MIEVAIDKFRGSFSLSQIESDCSGVSRGMDSGELFATSSPGAALSVWDAVLGPNGAKEVIT